MDRRVIGAGCALLALLVSGLPAGAADANRVLEAWLAAQAGLKTWTADSKQVRTLKTLAAPLVSTGRVWYASPDRFRWELGQPAQTIAVRNGEQMWVVYPRLKRAEHYDLRGDQTGPWRDALALMEAGFPRDRAALDRQFRLIALTATNGQQVLGFQPVSPSARRFIAEVLVALSVEPGAPAAGAQRAPPASTGSPAAPANAVALLATELVFADGSRMRNEFSCAVVNPDIDGALFTAPVPPDFTVTEPLKP